MLGKRGDFLPYGFALDDGGEARMVAGHPSDEDQPGSTAVLDLLVAGLRAERDGLRAVAVVSDVRLADSDAVRVELEHQDGHAIAVLLPYKHKRFGRGVDYRELMATAGVAHVWGD